MITMTEWQNKVAAVFSMTRQAKVSHSGHLELLRKYLYSHLEKKMPSGRPHYNQYMQGYVAGLIDAHRATLWKEFEFCYEYEGQLYSTGKEPSIHKKTEEIYGRNLGHVLKDGCHYWRDTHVKFN